VTDHHDAQHPQFEIRNPQSFGHSRRLSGAFPTALPSLFFLLPMIVVYELGTMIYATDYLHGTTHYIKARLMLLGFCEWFGAYGFLLPGSSWSGRCWVGTSCARTLGIGSRGFTASWPSSRCCCHAAAGFCADALASNASVCDASFGCTRSCRHAIRDGIIRERNGELRAEPSWQAQVVFSVGAGIYEELFFRLVGIALLHALLVDLLKLPEHWGAIAAVMLSAVAFALYHFSPGQEFGWGISASSPSPGSTWRCVSFARHRHRRRKPRGLRSDRGRPARAALNRPEARIHSCCGGRRFMVPAGGIVPI